MDAEVLAAHKAHLKVLRIQEAKLGVLTPPHIKTEIARIEKIISEAQQAIDIDGDRSNRLSPEAYRDVSRVFRTIIALMRSIETYATNCAVIIQRFDEEPDYNQDFSILAIQLTNETKNFSIYYQNNELFIPGNIDILLRKFKSITYKLREPRDKEDLLNNDKVAKECTELLPTIITEMRYYLGIR